MPRVVAVKYPERRVSVQKINQQLGFSRSWVNLAVVEGFHISDVMSHCRNGIRLLLLRASGDEKSVDHSRI
jgi:hypothetical protein